MRTGDDLPTWIYPERDEAFLKKLLETFRAIPGWEHTEVYQSQHILKHRTNGELTNPQYLATMDPKGIGGDKVHLWRDGQTWWPMSGDFSFADEDLIESTFKSLLKSELK